VTSDTHKAEPGSILSDLAARIPLEAVDHFVFALALFMIVLFPTQLAAVKIMILAIYAPLRILSLQGAGRLVFDRYNTLIPLFYASVGAVYCYYGLLAGTPGAVAVSTVHVAYPLLLGFLAGTCSLDESKKIVRLLQLLLGLASLLIVAVFALKLTGHKNIPLFDDSNASFGGGYTKLSFPLLSVLNFSVPFMLFSFLFRAGMKFGPLFYLVLIVTILDSIVTGRRGTWVVLLLSLFSLTFFARFRFSNLLILLLLIGAGVSLAFYFGGLRLDILADRMQAGFQFTTLADQGSAFARGAQFKSLMAGFADSPIFGHGLGSTAVKYGSLRSHDLPWAYELSYVYGLYSMGALGVMLYGAGIAWIGLQLFRLSRIAQTARYSTPVLAGFAGFLIANATNPYLEKFDYMFVIFIPYALACAGVRAFGRHGPAASPAAA
jgi:hypothetical protein